MVAITFVLDTYQIITWLNMSVKLSIIHIVIWPGGLEPASIYLFSFVSDYLASMLSLFVPAPAFSQLIS